MSQVRPHAPAAARNRDPILQVLRDWLPPTGSVLEIASGTGEHAVFFADHLPALTWQPTDRSQDIVQWITERVVDSGLANLLPPHVLDVQAEESWPAGPVDAVVAINMVHISPWEATQALMRGAHRVLAAGGPLVLYGPYRVAGEPFAPSNAAFDADLKRRDPAWGVRDLEAVVVEAASHGLAFGGRVDMPANNLGVVFRKSVS